MAEVESKNSSSNSKKSAEKSFYDSLSPKEKIQYKKELEIEKTKIDKKYNKYSKEIKNQTINSIKELKKEVLLL